MTSSNPGSSGLDISSRMNIALGLDDGELSVNAAVPQISPSLTYDMHAGGDSSSESHSPEMISVKASDRVSRIIAEKHRRSQFNSQIQQINSLLSDIVHPQRKLDKTSILRLAAHKLRNEHVFADTITCSHLETWSSAFLKYFDLLGGVMFTITCRGRICNVSPNVQEKLGYCYIDLLANNIYNYIHPDDRETLQRHIYPPELQSGCDWKILEQKHHSFNLRILKAGAKNDAPRYETCLVDGKIRRSDRATNNKVPDEQKIKRARVRHVRTFSSSGNDFVFIGMFRILLNPLPARILPPTAYSEYWTRHLVDGRIVQCDHSISLAAGYMTEEVTGTSAFVFMHKDDVCWVICVLRQMYDQSKEFGESYYRLMARSGEFIYMRTRGFLEIDRTTKKVQSFVCVNSVIGDEYGKKMIEEMKKKYSVIVDIDKERSNEDVIDDTPVENPKRIEDIIMHLIEPAANDSEDDLKVVAPPKENIISAIQASEKVVEGTGICFDSRKRKKFDYDSDSGNLKRCSGSYNVGAL